MNKSQFMTNTYIDLFVLNKCKHMRNMIGEKKTVLYYCCIQQILRENHNGIQDRTREEFKKDDILFGLRTGENLINDVSNIHLLIHISAGGGAFLFVYCISCGICDCN